MANILSKIAYKIFVEIARDNPILLDILGFFFLIIIIAIVATTPLKTVAKTVTYLFVIGIVLVVIVKISTLLNEDTKAWIMLIVIILGLAFLYKIK